MRGNSARFSKTFRFVYYAEYVSVRARARARVCVCVCVCGTLHIRRTRRARARALLVAEKDSMYRMHTYIGFLAPDSRLGIYSKLGIYR